MVHAIAESLITRFFQSCFRLGCTHPSRSVSGFDPVQFFQGHRWAIRQNPNRLVSNTSTSFKLGFNTSVLFRRYCNCGVFNFKRRDNCFKCSASREESEKGGEGSDEISNILTKSKNRFIRKRRLIKRFILNRNHVQESGCIDKRGKGAHSAARKDPRTSVENI